jgi:hypothetical protein
LGQAKAWAFGEKMPKLVEGTYEGREHQDRLKKLSELILQQEPAQDSIKYNIFHYIYLVQQ